MALSRLIYGLWRLGDSEDCSPAGVQAKIESCLAQGVTTFDQADIYGNYESEKLLGAALRDNQTLRAQMQIVTKCDIALATDKFPQRRVKYYDTSREYIIESVDTSLRNMHIEQIDLLLIHRPDPLMDAQETGATLDELIACGKVRAVGVSNFKPYDWELLQASMRNRLQTNQIELSLLANDSFNNGDLAFLQRQSIAPIAWSPLGGGRLFNSAKHHSLLQRLEEIGHESDVAPEAVAVAWLLKHPANILPILGTVNPERIARIADATKIELDRETWFELYTLALGHDVP